MVPRLSIRAKLTIAFAAALLLVLALAGLFVYLRVDSIETVRGAGYRLRRDAES